MGKTIVSPVKRFQGEVVISDPLTFPQVFAFEDAIAAVKELGGDSTHARVRAAWIPAFIACVEEWRLDKFPQHPTPENWPATPIGPVAELMAWLIRELTALLNEADEIPNA